jgi:hypothetical protein
MDITHLKAQYKAGERNFSGAQLSGVSLVWVELTGVNFEGADLSHANLSGANLSESNLSGSTNLTFTDLSRADLRNTNLKGTRLEGANLEGIQLEGAVYDETTKFPLGFDPIRVGAIFGDILAESIASSKSKKSTSLDSINRLSLFLNTKEVTQNNHDCNSNLQNPALEIDNSSLNNLSEIAKGDWKIKESPPITIHKQKQQWSKFYIWMILLLGGTSCIAVALILGLFNLQSPPAIISDPSSDATVTTENSTLTASPSTFSSSETLPNLTTQTSVTPIPRPNITEVMPESEGLSTEEANVLVHSWQTAKAEAMSERYSMDGIQSVLIEPALSEWKSRVAQNKAAQGYWNYTVDQLEIQFVETLEKGRSQIKARVKETAQYYDQGKLISAQSYTDTYLVKYTAVQQGQQWYIQDMQVQ